MGWWKLGRRGKKAKGKTIDDDDDADSDEGVMGGDLGGKKSAASSAADAAQRRRDSNNSKLRLMLNQNETSSVPKGQPSVASSVSDSLTANSGPSMFTMRGRQSSKDSYNVNKHGHHKRGRAGSASLTSGNASVTSFRSSM